MPPREVPEVARTIRIEDIDRGVKSWFDRVLDLHVTSPQGDRRKVPVKFSAGERWVAAADRQGIRDRDGRLILPVIHIRRTSIDPTQGQSALGSNVPRLQVARLVSEETSDLANLDDLRPISDRRLGGSAVYDIYTVPFPASLVAHYKVRCQMQYQTHMNEFIEEMVYQLEFFDVPSFVISLSGETRYEGIPTGEGSTEMAVEPRAIYEERKPLSDYYVVGYLDGPISDDGNMDEFTDQERILQLSFNFQVPVTLMLDPPGEHPAVHVERTAFGVRMGLEEVHVIENREQADRIFGRRK